MAHRSGAGHGDQKKSLGCTLMCEPRKNTERGCKNGTQKRSGSWRPEKIYSDCQASKKHQRPTEGITGRHPAVNDTNKRKKA
nr:MAG TPA: hypothetical protein [Microviridae sp.]